MIVIDLAGWSEQACDALAMILRSGHDSRPVFEGKYTYEN